MKTVEIKIVTYMEILFIIGMRSERIQLSGIKINQEVTECGIITNSVKYETYSMN